MPDPTMFKGRTIPAEPPVPSSLLDNSLCTARGVLFCRERGDDLGDTRGIRSGRDRASRGRRGIERREHESERRGGGRGMGETSPEMKE